MTNELADTENAMRLLTRQTEYQTRSRLRRARRAAILLVGLAAILLAAVDDVSAQVGKLTGNLMDDVAIEQNLDSPVPGELQFTDSQGRSVQLGDYFGDKPIILNLVYFRCPRLCKLSTDGLIRTLRTMEFSAGDEFRVLTVSFDPREGPEKSRAARHTALMLYDREGAETGWQFLTGEKSAIDSLTGSVGFRVAYDDKLDQYAHAAGLVILTPEGRVSRYLNGVEYPARDLRLALVEASENKIGSPTDQVLLFCYQYNPKIGKYSFAVQRLLQVFGIATLVTIAGGIVLMLRRERQQETVGAEP